MASRRKTQAEKAALDERQKLALAALLDCRPAEEAAAAAGVDLDTLADWQVKHDAFIIAYNGARRSQFEQRGDKLRLLALKAADSLGELLENENPIIRLKAIALLTKTLEAMPHGGRPDGPVTHRQLEQERLFNC